MLTKITQGQLLTYRLGRMKDEGTMTPQQVSLAKRANCDLATDIAREARRLLGANGILVEYHSMRHMANLRAGQDGVGMLSGVGHGVAVKRK